jgi:D-threo-aldose 1-dehydrogenase
MGNLKTRRVGKTGVEVTELGFGSATLAGLFAAVPDDQARGAATAALDAGITYFDTAPQYGFGRAEHLVGDALRDRRKGIVLSSKVGRLLKPYTGTETSRANWVQPFPFEQVYDYSYDAIMRSVEDSRQRLGLAEIDMLFVHDIGVATHGVEQNAIYWKQLDAGGGYRALQDLKKAGSVKAIGLGVNEWEVLMDAFKLGDWDVFLLAGRYTLLEQTSLDPFLTTCMKRGASVIAAAPFNGGALMGTGKWNYGTAPQAIIDRVHQLEAFCKAQNVPIGAAALQFALTHPAVCSVLTGPRSAAELKSTLAWWNTPIPDSFWHDLAAAKLVAPGTPLPGGRTA